MNKCDKCEIETKDLIRVPDYGLFFCGKCWHKYNDLMDRAANKFMEGDMPKSEFAKHCEICFCKSFICDCN